MDSKRQRRPVVVTPEVRQLRQGANSTTVVLHKIRALWTDASVVIDSRSALLPSELSTFVRPWPDPTGSEAERTLCTYLQRPESHAASAKVLAKMQQTDRHIHLDKEPRTVRALLLVHLDTAQQAAYAAVVEDPRMVASDCEHTTAVCHVLLNWPSIRKGFKNPKRAVLQTTYDELQISRNTGISEHLRSLTTTQTDAEAKRVLGRMSFVTVSSILKTIHTLHVSNCVRKHLELALAETPAFLLWPCDPCTAHIVPFAVAPLPDTRVEPLSHSLREFVRDQKHVLFLDTSAKGHGGKTVHAQQRLHNDNLPGTAVWVAPAPVPSAEASESVLTMAQLGFEAVRLMVAWLGRVRIVIYTIELLLSANGKAVGKAVQFFQTLDVTSPQAVAPEMSALVALLRSNTEPISRSKTASCRSGCQLSLKARLESTLGPQQLDGLILVPFLHMLKVFWRQHHEDDRPSWYIDCFRQDKERIIHKLKLFQHSIPCQTLHVCSTNLSVQWGDLVNMYSEFSGGSPEALRVNALIPPHLMQSVLGLVVPSGRWERALNTLLPSASTHNARDLSDRLAYVDVHSGATVDPVFLWYGASAINVGLSSLDAVEHKKGSRLADCAPEERTGPRFRVDDRHREPGIILHTPQPVDRGYAWTEDLIRLWDHLDGILEAEALAISSWSPLACRRHSGTCAHKGPTHLTECDFWSRMEGIGQLTHAEGKLLMDAVTTDLVYERTVAAVTDQLRSLVAYQYLLREGIHLPLRLLCLYTWAINVKRHNRNCVFPVHVVSRQLRLVFGLTGNVGVATELYSKRGCADQSGCRANNKRRRWT